MKNLTVSLFFATLLALGCNANDRVVNDNRVEASATAENDGAATKTTPVKDVDLQAEFPGGEAELGKFLIQNMRYPVSAIENGIKGTVMVKFVVDKEGKIDHESITVDNSVNSDLAAEAVRLVKLFPNFKPALANGENVDSWYIQQFVFKLKS